MFRLTSNVLALTVTLTFSGVLNAELVFVIQVLMCLFLLLKNKLRIERSFFSFLCPLLFIGLCGTVYAGQNEPVNLVKDSWYLIKIVPAIMVGWMAAKFMSIRDILLGVLFSGTLLASHHILSYFFYLAQGYGPETIRIIIASNPLSVLLLGVFFANKFFRDELNMGPSASTIFFVINFYSIYLSDSRSSYIALFCFFLVLNGFYKANARTALTLIVVTGFISVGASFLSVDENLSPGERESLDSRFARGLDEIIPSEGEDRASRSLSFRGYEAFRAIQEFSDGSVGEKIFGKGLGATIDLGETWVLGGVFGEESGEVEFDRLLIIHNGYLQVLVKYGILGLLSYIYFIFSWIRLDRRNTGLSFRDEMFARLMVANLLVFLMYSLLITGLFNKSAFSAWLIVLGALLWRQNKMRVSAIFGSSELKSSLAIPSFNVAKE